MISKKRNIKYLDVLRKMPPLYHTLPGEEFSAEKSEVLQWILSDRDALLVIAQRVFSDAKNRNMVIYDKNTGKWHGADHGMESEEAER